VVHLFNRELEYRADLEKHSFLKHESSELMAALLEVGHAGKTAFIPEPVVHRFALNLSLTLNYGTR
jgi:3-hydroxyphenylacetate 6-hydroxylase